MRMTQRRSSGGEVLENTMYSGVENSASKESVVDKVTGAHQVRLLACASLVDGLCGNRIGEESIEQFSQSSKLEKTSALSCAAIAIPATCSCEQLHRQATKLDMKQSGRSQATLFRVGQPRKGIVCIIPQYA